MQSEALEGVVMQAGADIDSHVMAVLLKKFQLGAHCEAMKRYLLLGQVLPFAFSSLFQVSMHMQCKSLFVKMYVDVLSFCYAKLPYQQFVKVASRIPVNLKYLDAPPQIFPSGGSLKSAVRSEVESSLIG